MVTTVTPAGLAEIREAVAAVVDPELPTVTIADLGILRAVGLDSGRVAVTITPTYSGCPALETIRYDIRAALRDIGHHDVDIRVTLAPPWTTDRITAAGRAKLTAAGIAPPAVRGGGPVPLLLTAGGAPVSLTVGCPHCGSADTEELSRFSSTACKALWRCRSCGDPFDRVKEH